MLYTLCSYAAEASHGLHTVAERTRIVWLPKECNRSA